MKLVSDAKQAWRWFSVQALALIAVLPVVWSQLPPEVVALIPGEWLPYIAAGMAILGIIGRLVDQGSARE